MYTPDERAALLASLVAAARADPQVTAAATIGSAAVGADDEWSDIDLALGLIDGVQPARAAESWTAELYAQHGAVHHLDVWSGPALYRVFLLGSTLQVDLSLWPHGAFRAIGPAFRLIFGEAERRDDPAPAVVEQIAGMGWLYALHVRSALARGRRWQAVHMLDGLRDQIIALACLRHGLPTAQGRGVDRLPENLQLVLASCRARTTDSSDLAAAFAGSCAMLLAELTHHDQDLADRLRPTVHALVASAG